MALLHSGNKVIQLLTVKSISKHNGRITYIFICIYKESTFIKRMYVRKTFLDG